MITKCTTLILGAGSSVPYGYPTGAQLIEQIIDLLNWSVFKKDGNTILLKEVLESRNQFLCYPKHLRMAKFCYEVRKSAPSNIDCFLRDNPSFESLGREIVSFLIKYCEVNDNGLIIPESVNRNIAGYPWYPILFEALVGKSGNKLKDLPELNKLRIITFNYDVSLEYFLASTLLGNERTRPYAKKIFESIPIVHMFGKVANVTIDNNIISYNYGSTYKRTQTDGKIIDNIAWADTEETNLHVAIENKHVHPDVQHNSIVAKNIIKASDYIVCMGFDFADGNCALLNLEESFWAEHPTFYMNYRGSNNLDSRVHRWRGTTGNMIRMNAKTCYNALFDEYDLTREH